MTGRDSQAARDERTPEAAVAGSALKRVSEWFWRGAALRAERRNTTSLSPRAQLLAQRARETADAASVTHTSKPWESAHEAVACELYRQAAYWAACASAEEPTSSERGREDAAAWATLDERFYAPPEGGLATSAVVRELASSGSFVHFAELPRDELRPALLSMRELTRAALAKLEEREARVKSLHRQRLWRIGTALALVLGVVCGVQAVRAARLQRSELAAGKSWRTSSNYGGGCTSPEQKCPENTGYFFHTRENERNPWIEFDLAGLRQISAVEVENREDCCSERALPLVLEISQDHRTWKAVARREADFSTWHASFDSVTARWVRLRVMKTSALHLHAVRIYP